MQRHALCAIGIAVLLSATALGQDEKDIAVLQREQVEEERLRQAACAPLLAKLKALQGQREEMAKEMLPTDPKLKEINAQIGSVAKELVDVGGNLPAGVKVPPLDLDLGNGVTMKLVYIAPGEFMMGSPANEKERDRDEGPQHRVRITKGFYMGTTEVPQAQYEAVMGNTPSWFKGKDNPVEQVSWNDAVEFCGKLSEKTGQIVRLPTEAEWEYACRAGTMTAYSWGGAWEAGVCNAENDVGSNDDSNVEVFRRRGLPVDSTMSVGTFSANAWGLYDMHGNVWEWCSSLYKPYPYQADNGRDNLRAEGSRVLRGGSWGFDRGYCRSAYRCGNAPTYRSDHYGFRVVVRAQE